MTHKQNKIQSDRASLHSSVPGCEKENDSPGLRAEGKKNEENKKKKRNLNRFANCSTGPHNRGGACPPFSSANVNRGSRGRTWRPSSSLAASLTCPGSGPRSAAPRTVSDRDIHEAARVAKQSFAGTWAARVSVDPGATIPAPGR
jgi:hypothetical protein